MQTQLLPWQQSQWQQLLLQWQQQRLPHALLLQGQMGLGKQNFANYLSQFILCQDPNKIDKACDQCHACRLFLAYNHPDFFRITPTKKQELIKVEQIRQLIQDLTLTSPLGGYTIAYIHPAQSMNTAAFNSLLKTLEEPTPKTLLILVSDTSKPLPATIVSRCQPLLFAPPSQSLGLQWLRQQSRHPQDVLLLKLAAGSPLLALELSETEQLNLRTQLFADCLAVMQGQGNIVKVAEVWAETYLKLSLFWLLSWFRDMVALKLQVAEGQVINCDQIQSLQSFASQLNFIQLYQCIDQIMQTQQLFTTHTTINKTMILEQLFIGLQQTIVEVEVE